MDIDLSLVSMDEIWAEIKRRSDAAVLIEMKTLDDNRESSQISYKGGKFTCLGMTEKARNLLLMDMMNEERLSGEP